MERVDLLLINPPFHQRNGSSLFFPLGLGYIISAVKQVGYSCEVIDCSQMIQSYFDADLQKLKQMLQAELDRFEPVLVGIGPCITTQIRTLKIISNICLEHYGSERVFAGGPLASIDGQEWFFWEQLGLQYIIKGDGEEAVAAALTTLKSGHTLGQCKHVTSERYQYYNVIEDIDQIAFPWRMWQYRKIISSRRSSSDVNEVTVPMITSRGCPYNCAYCVSGNMPYKRFRKRSYENIADEIASLVSEHGVTDIIFYDDCFFYNPRTANDDVIRFVGIIKERGIHVKWQMEVRPDLFLELNKNSMLALKEAGCRQINLGIEKMNDARRTDLGKMIHADSLPEQIGTLKSLTDIRVAATFILGGANESEEDILREIAGSTKLNLDFAHYNPLFIYPGTPLYNDMFSNEKEWVDHILNDPLPWGEVVYESGLVKKERLIELANYAYEVFYEEKSSSDRKMVTDRFRLGEKNYENV